MKRFKITIGAATLAVAALAGNSARADFHFFYIREIFSNHDGSVQFIELFTTVAGQQNLHPLHSITSTTNQFPFPADSPTPTNNRHLLIATEGFGAIPGGATPNYTIPANFFNPAGDTITFGEGVSVQTFGGANPLPTDGIHSLNYTSFFSAPTVAVNSPRNHAGAGTSVDLSPPMIVTTGDYNGNGVVDAADYTIWRKTLDQTVATLGDGADGDKSGTIDAGDFSFWKERFGDVVAGAGGGATAPAVPEPSGLLPGCLAASLLALLRRRQ